MAKKIYRFQVEMCVEVEVEAYCKDEAQYVVDDLHVDNISKLSKKTPRVIKTLLTQRED